MAPRYAKPAAHIHFGAMSSAREAVFRLLQLRHDAVPYSTFSQAIRDNYE